jgi:hypothetical protein
VTEGSAGAEEQGCGGAGGAHAGVVGWTGGGTHRESPGGAAGSWRRCKVSWTVVRGIYKQGIVEPIERVPHREGVEVLLLFPERLGRAGTKGLWSRMKQQMSGEMPDLLSMTDDEKRAEFDKLSDMIAERLPYHSVEELERAMRGDEYGLVGY